MAEFPLSPREILEAAASGEYPIYEGYVAPQTPKLVLSHGTSERANRPVIDHGLHNIVDSTLIMADENAAKFFMHGEHKPMVFVGSISTHRYGMRPGTSGIIRAARHMLAVPGERLQLRFSTNAHMAARVALQAHVEGIEAILEPGMPSIFCNDSEQAWTRSVEEWVAYEKKYLRAYVAMKVAQQKLPLSMLRF